MHLDYFKKSEPYRANETYRELFGAPEVGWGSTRVENLSRVKMQNFGKTDLVSGELNMRHSHPKPST
jgi:hypothetical protein